MNYKAIAEALEALNVARYNLEAAYIENEGEVTEETEGYEAAVEEIKALLQGEGIDTLGQWLKSVEDEKKELKAQKDYVSRRITAADKTIEFVKAKIHDILKALDKEKVKGALGYVFERTISTRSSVLTDDLDKAYLDIATKAARAAGLPEFVDVALKTNVTRLNECAEGSTFVHVETAPAVTFTKPRANKD